MIFRLPWVTIKFVHETIRIMNMCHWPWLTTQEIIIRPGLKLMNGIHNTLHFYTQETKMWTPANINYAQFMK